MKIKLGSGLTPQNLLVVLLIIIIVFAPSLVVRIVFGLPFVLFFPGYSLILALFPRKDRLGNIERIALSFGLSIAVVPLIGLILNYTPLGITLYSTLYSITGFIFAMSLIAWIRLRRLGYLERFNIEFEIKKPTWSGNRWDKVLSVILVVSILAAIGVLSYVIASPKVGERFTEFYILGLSGEAIDYPKEIRVGEEGKVIVGIVNREHEVVSYRMEVMIDGVKNNEVGPVVLDHEQKWEEIVSFIPDKAGDNLKVGFILYMNEEVELQLETHLWIDVTN